MEKKSRTYQKMAISQRDRKWVETPRRGFVSTLFVKCPIRPIFMFVNHQSFFDRPFAIDFQNTPKRGKTSI